MESLFLSLSSFLSDRHRHARIEDIPYVIAHIKKKGKKGNQRINYVNVQLSFLFASCVLSASLV